MRGPTLRLICVNDVYLLDHLPRLRTLVRHFSEVAPADVTLTTLAGDFIAPSLLSSLDHGRGMIDCLNAIPVTHVCFGNHEQDIPAAALRERVREFAGAWLNTNIPGYEPPLPASQVLEVRGAETRGVRVGLVGGVTEDPTLYHPDPFGPHEMLPLNATLLAAARALEREQGCVCTIALTHQAMARDQALARAQGSPAIPLILGGHEHEPHLEQLGSAWLVKAGTDALYAAVVDLAWPAAVPAEGPDLPAVSVRLVPVAEFAEDPALRTRADNHLRAVRDLAAATLLRLGPGVVLSSVGSRLQQTSVGTLIASRVRDALGAEACVINGGGIRGSREYREVFTFGDIETELPFPNEMVVVSMPGRVLREAIAFSRSRRPAPGFLQVDDGIAVDAQNTLLQVAGAPLDPERDYQVATVRVLLNGMDGITPLLAFRDAFPERVPPAGSGRELKIVAVEAFALELWRAVGPFENVDTDRDERVSVEELRAAVMRATREVPQGLMIEGVLRALDANGDRMISRAEAARALRPGGTG